MLAHVGPLARRLARYRGLSTVTGSGLSSSSFDPTRERDLLQHVIRTSTEGDPDSVTAAMDSFWDAFYSGEGSAEWQLRGSALDEAISKKNPSVAMEIGTYCGYTAVRMGRLLPPDGKLVSVEIDPLYAAIATKVVEYAGLRDRVSIEIGSLGETLPRIIGRYGFDRPLDAVLLDHEPGLYLSDLQLLDGKGLVSEATTMLCDWSLYPGDEHKGQAPTAGKEFMQYLRDVKGSVDSVRL